MSTPDVSKTTDPARIRNYLADESAAFHGHADELFLPETEAEVVDVVRHANAAGKRITTSAGGTSITGSRVPVHGGTVLSAERMVRVEGDARPGFEAVTSAGFTIHVDREGRRAVAPPAIPLATLDTILARHDLCYPPDPTEMSAHLSGTVATNASGARSFHYGPTRDWVRRLRVVLPTGEVAELRRGDPAAEGPKLSFKADARTVHVPLPAPGQYDMPRTKNAAGLYLTRGMEPIDLFIGSEGLLGVVTEVEIALIDRPAHTLTVVAYFRDRDRALDFVDAGVSDDRPFDYLSLEYFSGTALDFMRDAHPDIPAGVAAAVLFELVYAPEPGSPYPPNGLLGALRAELARHQAACDWSVPSGRREEVRLFRHALPESVNEFVRRHVGKIGTDMAVPHDRFREMMDAYERESAATGVRFLIFGHIGDDHVHLNYLPEQEEAAARAKEAYVRLARKAVALGGTISAEHGVGKKTVPVDGREVPYLLVQYGEAGLRAVARVKTALDPNRILNIGNMVPAEMLG
ncbi:MAG: FAD-binding oxidoreductase [Planctomycetota bacterium]